MWGAGECSSCDSFEICFLCACYLPHVIEDLVCSFCMEECACFLSVSNVIADIFGLSEELKR